MSQALEKLHALLKRVEERKAAPRLRAVAFPVATPTAAAAPAPVPMRQPEPASVPSFATLPPVALPTPPAAVVPVSAPVVDVAPAAVSVFPPAPGLEPGFPGLSEPPRKALSSSPLEAAMAQLDDSGPLQVESLAEPIVPVRYASLEASPRAQHTAVTHRPEGDPGDFDMPIELTQPAKRPAEREPTVEFETAKVRVSARELRAIGEPAVTEPALLAPSETLEAPALVRGTQPVRAVSPARIEAPKSFGELLERSLALRPKG